MKLEMFIVDAFSERTLSGNPAAVCPLDAWIPDETMQAIAGEMNLSETVFFVSNGDHFDIRWFTPTREVDLIGHATLAAGYLVLERIRPQLDAVTFRQSDSHMTVRRKNDHLTIEMPSLVPKPIPCPPALPAALGATPRMVLASKHYLCVFDHQDEVARLTPDMIALAQLDLAAVIVTAPGHSEFDFVSRFFAPANGVPEDPVSGVAHCCLIPYWAERLGLKQMTARQLSARGGVLACELHSDRVQIAGAATIFLEGHIHV